MQDTGDIEGVTLPATSVPASSAQVAVRRALQRAESLVKAQKTKNASNKNKEHTSLAGAIVKLLEKDQHPSDGMAANMSMMLMQQMEAINKSMDKRAHRGKTRGGKGSVAKNAILRRGQRRGQRRQPSKGWWIMEATPWEGAAVIVVVAATAVTAAKATATVALEMGWWTLLGGGHFYIKLLFN